MLMECVKFGTVVRVGTPEAQPLIGSVCITFETVEGARGCAAAMHGRWFDQRQIQAEIKGNITADGEGGEEGGEGGKKEATTKEEEEEEAKPERPQLPLTSHSGGGEKDELTSFLSSV
ncbi:unnamed protein product [Discosporangium mesarthrocarpum]